jgi:hypothetical protein
MTEAVVGDQLVAFPGPAPGPIQGEVDQDAPCVGPGIGHRPDFAPAARDPQQGFLHEVAGAPGRREAAISRLALEARHL